MERSHSSSGSTSSNSSTGTIRGTPSNSTYNPPSSNGEENNLAEGFYAQNQAGETPTSNRRMGMNGNGTNGNGSNSIMPTPKPAAPSTLRSTINNNNNNSPQTPHSQQGQTQFTGIQTGQGNNPFASSASASAGMNGGGTAAGAAAGYRMIAGLRDSAASNANNNSNANPNSNSESNNNNNNNNHNQYQPPQPGENPSQSYITSPQSQTNGNEPWGSPFPSLHLWPINETFVMKMIALSGNQRIKIGRQTNAKTAPGEKNGYFDSKVLSRMHAELWEEKGKIYIKDVKSSNGTFINGDRLSAEGVESEPFELKSEDMVEFGIDIVSEDNKTVLHHKVSAKAYCVFNVDDAGLSARELTQYYPHDPRTSMGPARRVPGQVGPASSNAIGPNGQVMTTNMLSAGGKIQGLNFDHLLHKLQLELQKSQDTGEELRGLTEAMEGIQETLSGGVAPEQNGSAEHHIPPQFRANTAQIAGGVPVAAMGDTTATIAALQAQLSTTQSILVSHKDRIKSLESLLQEHEAIKDEVLGMRRQMEESKQEIEMLLRVSEEKAAEEAARQQEVEDTSGGDDMGSDSERGSEARRRSGLRRELDRSKTPDLGAEEEDIADGGMRHSRSISDLGGSSSPLKSPRTPGSRLLSPGVISASREEEIVAQNNALGARLDTLSAELGQALQLSKSLHDQHAEATSAVKILEERVQTLERDVAEKTDAASKVNRAAEDKWEIWRIKFEEGWRKERESWEGERERLRGVVREWEEASRRAQEEDEERSMNAKLSGDEALLSDSDEEDDDDSDFDDHNGGVLARSAWLGSGLSGSDPESQLNGLPDGVPRRSHSASPRSSRSGGKSGRHRPSRRSSSSRLDPAIRALRATVGEPEGGLPDLDGVRNRFMNTGSSTPRTGSPSAADQALGALRNKSGRVDRAKTITGRRPGKSTDSDGNATEPPSAMKKTRTKSGLSKTASVATVKQLRRQVADEKEGEDGDEDGREQTPMAGEGNSTSGESDETAHENIGEKKTQPVREASQLKEEYKAEIPAGGLGIVGQNPIPLAISIAVLGVGIWAVLNRARE